MTESEQKILIKRATEGDIRAFETLVKQHRQKLHSFALSITGGDYASAGDILQEALLNAYLYIKNFKGESSFTSWLWRIVRNEFLKHQKNPKTAVNLYLEELKLKKEHGVNDVEAEVIKNERKKNIRKIVSTLSVKYSEAVTLIVFQEMSYDEASEILNVSVNTLKSRVLRAKEKISELVLENRQLFL